MYTINTTLKVQHSRVTEASQVCSVKPHEHTWCRQLQS